MFLLEINEFDPELMQLAATSLGCKNLQRLLSFQHSQTTTLDQHERFGLDPWVQWVSIHTGKTSAEHGVGHLGDVPALRYPQMWERLDAAGYTCGVWGAMNASKGSAEKAAFFFPDPWTFSEAAFPAELNDLLAFPRYYSKNYCDLDKAQLAKEFGRLIRFCLRPKIACSLLPQAPRIIWNILKGGLSEYLLFVLFDVVNAVLFARYYRSHKPQFSLLFLNSIAHLQHHKWTIDGGLSVEMKVAFRLFDHAIGILFSALKDEPNWVVTNAFSQFCSVSQDEYLYRQKNPESFLASVGIAFSHVEQAMTNDGHVFFASPEEAEHAERVLKEAHIAGQAAFHVERAPLASRLFFQFQIWERIEQGAVLMINGQEYPFYSLFEEVTLRTGSHKSQGDIYSRQLQFPATIQNHEIYNYILASFGLERAH